MKIEPISKDNVEALARLSLALWPEGVYEEEYQRYADMLSTHTKTCFLARDENDYVAFIYLSLRTDYVEGTTTSPVAYIEGIYVQPAYRHSGIGRQLVAVGEEWGRSKGCRQYASDVEWRNEQSIIFHNQVGFQEVGRLVCFVKDISLDL